ncbi:MAG: Ig-like domain-containing protein, partial [Gammaproteobacteria bacterium]
METEDTRTVTFKHTLSKRRALLMDRLAPFMEGWRLAPLALIVACTMTRDAVPTAPGLRVVSLMVIPETTSVDADQELRFVAYGRRPNGDSVPGAVTWSATGGWITTQGVFRADTVPGEFQVTAESGEWQLSASSRVRVRGRGHSLTQVIVVPASVTLGPGEAQQFAAYGRTKNGDSVAASVSWTTTAGTVTTGGRYAAPAVAGSYAVIAAESGGLADTAEVTVVAAPVASVTVTPGVATVTVGGTVQLVAIPRDAGGNPLPGRSVSWASSNTGIATVSSSGVVSGVAAGPATITASSEGHAGTSTVGVTSGSGTVDTVFLEGFESGTLTTWDDNFLAERKSIVTDPTAAHSGARSLKILYPKGAAGGGGALSRFFMPGYDQLYARYYVRFPTNWQGGTKLLLLRGSGTDDVWSSFGVAGKCPTGTDFFATNVVYYAPALQFYTYYPGMPRQSDNVTCWGVDGNAASPPAVYYPPLTISLGIWHLVEFEVVLNTPGQANGRQRFWLDGVLRGEWSGLMFRTTRDLMLNVLTLESSAAPAPQDQALHVDDILVTTARP